MWRGSLAFYESQLGSGKVTYPNKAVREYASDWTAQSATRTGQRFTRMREYTTWQWPDRTKGPPSILVSRVRSDSNKSSIIRSMSRKAHALLLDRKPYILLVRDFLNLSMRWFHQQWKWHYCFLARKPDKERGCQLKDRKKLIGEGSHFQLSKSLHLHPSSGGLSLHVRTSPYSISSP